MSEINNAVAEVAKREEEEEKQLQVLDKALEGLTALSKAFRSFATKDELAEAEGRRCILAISGLKTTKKNYFFEITGSQILLREPYTTYTTLIVAPLDSVLRVFKGVAAGDKWAFSNEYARGKAYFKGEKHLHDMYSLSEAFKRFAELTKKYGGGVGIDLGI